VLEFDPKAFEECAWWQTAMPGMQSGALLVIDERSAGCRSLPLGTHFCPLQ
jgi:hypothetical protein